MFLIGLLGFGATSAAVRPRPRHGAADPLPHPPGRRRSAARARLAGPPHGHLLRRGAGSGLRPVGRRLGRHHAPGAGGRRPAGRRRSPGGWPSSSTSRSWPSPPTRRGATCRRAATSRPRAASTGSARSMSPWPSAACRFGAHLRRRARLVRPARRSSFIGVGHRRAGRLPLPDAPPAGSAGAAGALPLAPLHGDQHLDVPDLRRAVRLLLLPGALHPGHAGLHGGRRRPRGPARRSPPDLLLAAFRHPRRPPRAAPLHGRRPRSSWPLACCGWRGRRSTASPGSSSRATWARGCRRAATSSTCCRASCSSASASRCWSRP